MQIRIADASDWQGLTSQGLDTILDPMVIRCGELFLSVILAELSAAEYDWNPSIEGLAHRLESEGEKRLAGFLLGGLIFGGYAQELSGRHILQPKRSRLFLAVALGKHTVEHRLEDTLFTELKGRSNLRCDELKVKTFVGTSAQALKIQIWTALIDVLLIKYLQLRAAFGWSLPNLVALLRQQLSSTANCGFGRTIPSSHRRYRQGWQNSRPCSWANWTKDLDSRNKLTLQNSAITTFGGSEPRQHRSKAARGNGQPALRRAGERLNYAVFLRLPRLVLS